MIFKITRIEFFIFSQCIKLKVLMCTQKNKKIKIENKKKHLQYMKENFSRIYFRWKKKKGFYRAQNEKPIQVENVIYEEQKKKKKKSLYNNNSLNFFLF